MKEQRLRLTISSPEKEIFNGEVKLVTLPGALGSFTILPRHAPIVSTLIKGNVVYVLPDDNRHKVEIEGGFIEMNNNILSVCIS